MPQALKRVIPRSPRWLAEKADATLHRLLEAGTLKDFPKLQCVVRRGEPFGTVGLLVQGALKISVTWRDGHRRILGLLQPGDLFGLLPVLDGMGHGQDIWTRSKSLLLLVPGDCACHIRTTAR